MPKQVLTRRRSWTARIAVLAVVFSIFAVALPASAHSVAIDTSTSCPPTTPNAGFTDIGAFGADVQLAINCLFMYGITQGTTATTYSPNGTVLRWQMALFLVRQAADHGLTVPVAASQGYTDIAGLPQATIDAINQVTQLGISKGTSSTTFSPNDPVTRWQMALFLHRLAVRAGVTVTDDPLHNQFIDISAYTAEIQAAINFLADGHIALGIGGSIYDGNSNVLRWQMALFLTRVLAADGVVPPVGFRVTVTPTAAASQGAGTARAFTATFRNADGSAYTGAVGITLRAVVSSVVEYDNVPPANATIESTSDPTTLSAPGVTVVGFPGTDGIVSFTVRHVGPGQTVVPIAWEDLNGDGDPEISGNAAPTEPHGLGGQTTFAATALIECETGVAPITGDGAFAVTAVDKAGDRYEANLCSLFYDSGDVFLILGAPTDLAGFEAALNTGDTVTSTYNPDAAGQSTFNITTNTDPGVTVTDPVAAGVTVDANSYAIKGTGTAGFTVAIYTDANDNTAIDGLDAKVGEGLVAGDGTWSISVPLTQGQPNNFTANQRSAPASANGTPVNVPTITEGANTGATITASTGGNGGTAGVLDTGDTVTIDFNENVNAPVAGNTLDVSDASGTQARVTCGGNATCAAVDANTIRFTVNGLPTILVAGGDSLVVPPAVIQALGGITGTDGLAVNVAGSALAARTFVAF